MASPGRATRRTNGSSSSSAPGPHRLEIRKDGYRTYMTDITVRPGGTTPLNVAMTRSAKLSRASSMSPLL